MADESKDPFVEMFEDPARAQAYSAGPPAFTPGFSDVHKMVAILLEERLPPNGDVLVHGAGGGLELEALAQRHTGWQFVGVDPAKAMLDEAATRLGSLMQRITLHRGYIDTAPAGPFDGATSLLTLHFLDIEDRIDTVRQIAARLKPGAPLVVVHQSFPQKPEERARWLDRYEAFARANGVPAEMAQGARQGVGGMTTLLEPEQDIDVLRNAGLTRVSPFYRAFAWSGWVGYAPG